jgi:hypothetical protein
VSSFWLAFKKSNSVVPDDHAKPDLYRAEKKVAPFPISAQINQSHLKLLAFMSSPF